MSELGELIAALSAMDAKARTRAAGELYRRGRKLGDAVVNVWREDAELASLLTGEPTVGIAVQPDSFRRIRTAWGNPRLAEVPPDQEAEEFELHTDGARLDILTTKGGGAIERFLQKFGEGIQQVEYPVRDVDRATERLRARGLQPVYPATRAGADDTRVNFFLAAAPDGSKVLIELVEQPAA